MTRIEYLDRIADGDHGITSIEHVGFLSFNILVNNTKSIVRMVACIGYLL